MMGMLARDEADIVITFSAINADRSEVGNYV